VGLNVETVATIGLDEHSFPNEAGFRFGLADEKFSGKRLDIDAPPTDAAGKANLNLDLGEIPDLTKPLAVTIQVSVFEPSGRAVTETLTRPIWQRPLGIGLRLPAGDEAVPEGQPASIDIIALDGDGKRSAAKALRWELLRESWQYAWYSVNGTWRHRTQVRDQPVETGTVDIGADGAATLSRTLPAGRYRLEVADSASGAQTSLRFHVGWWVEVALPDVPDKLAATLDKTGYKPARPQSCSSRRRSLARPSWRSPRTKCLRCGPSRFRRRGPRSRSRSMPPGAAASMRWSAPIGRKPPLRRGRRKRRRAAQSERSG